MYSIGCLKFDTRVILVYTVKALSSDRGLTTAVLFVQAGLR